MTDADLGNLSLLERISLLEERVTALQQKVAAGATAAAREFEACAAHKCLAARFDSQNDRNMSLSLEEEIHHRDSMQILDALQQQSRVISLASMVANPTPLGLFAFGVTTLLAGADLYGATAKNTFSVALIIGGLAQILAGMWCFRRNNTFGATAFSLFGSYWGARGVQLLVELLHPGLFPSADRAGTCIFYVIFCILTLILLVQALRMNYALSATVFFVALVYIFLAITAYVEGVKYVAATCAIIAGSLAFYVGLADFTNEIYEKPLIPLFPHPRHARDYEEGKRYVPRPHAHKSAVDIPPV
jgi:succinate-acetate transporter protein